MAQNQHYVPQFYLRYFSKDSKTINIFNLKSRKFFNGSIRGQCSKRNFYGNDEEIEKGFSQLEYKASAVLKSIVKKESLQIPFNDYVVLLTFVIWQSGRTKKIVEDVLTQINEVFNSLKKDIADTPKAKELGITVEELNRYEITHDFPSIETSLSAFCATPLLTDLSMALLVNKTERQFVISDAPVVLFNSFFSGKIKGEQTGYACKGLQVFFPLTPQYMIMLYDPEYYHLPDEQRHRIVLENEEDVRMLNGLQIIFCLENIYYLDYDICDLSLQHKELERKREQDYTTESYGIKKTDIGTSELICTTKSHPFYNLRELSFMRIYPNADPVPGVRDKGAYDEHKGYMKMLSEEKD